MIAKSTLNILLCINVKIIKITLKTQARSNIIMNYSLMKRNTSGVYLHIILVQNVKLIQSSLLILFIWSFIAQSTLGSQSQSQWTESSTITSAFLSQEEKNWKLKVGQSETREIKVVEEVNQWSLWTSVAFMAQSESESDDDENPENTENSNDTIFGKWMRNESQDKNQEQEILFILTVTTEEPTKGIIIVNDNEDNNVGEDRKQILISSKFSPNSDSHQMAKNTKEPNSNSRPSLSISGSDSYRFKLNKLSPTNDKNVGVGSNVTSANMTKKARMIAVIRVNGSVFAVDENNVTWEYPINMRFNQGHVVSIVVYSILMIISAVGNITVLGTIIRVRMKARLNRVNLFLLHLAIADLLVTFLLMPLEIVWAYTVQWRAGDAMCRIMSFFRIFGLFLSGFLLVCISLDRYFAVLKPLALPEANRRGRLMLSAAWGGSFICSLPQVFIFHVEQHPLMPWFEQCVTFGFFTSETTEILYSVFGFVLLYGFPLVMIVACYLCILFEIFRINSLSRLGSEDLRRSSMGALGRAKIRTLKMTVVIVAAFFLCWTPYNVMSLWYWIDRTSAQKVDLRIQKGLFLFAVANSCVNPMVYGFFHTRRKKEVGSNGGGIGAAPNGQQKGSSNCRLQRIENEQQYKVRVRWKPRSECLCARSSTPINSSTARIGLRPLCELNGDQVYFHMNGHTHTHLHHGPDPSSPNNNHKCYNPTHISTNANASANVNSNNNSNGNGPCPHHYHPLNSNSNSNPYSTPHFNLHSPSNPPLPPYPNDSILNKSINNRLSKSKEKKNNRNRKYRRNNLNAPCHSRRVKFINSANYGASGITNSQGNGCIKYGHVLQEQGLNLNVERTTFDPGLNLELDLVSALNLHYPPEIVKSLSSNPLLESSFLSSLNPLEDSQGQLKGQSQSQSQGQEHIQSQNPPQKIIQTFSNQICYAKPRHSHSSTSPPDTPSILCTSYPPKNFNILKISDPAQCSPFLHVNITSNQSNCSEISSQSDVTLSDTYTLDLKNSHVNPSIKGNSFVSLLSLKSIENRRKLDGHNITNKKQKFFKKVDIRDMSDSDEREICASMNSVKRLVAQGLLRESTL